MRFIKKYKIILAVIVPVMLLVIVRSLDSNQFKPDAVKWAEPSMARANLINSEKFTSLSGEKLLIVLDGASHSIQGDVKLISITSESLLQKENIKLIKKNDGPILLLAPENSSAASIWMIMSQMGIKDIYISEESGGSEEFKHEFRPDTLISPEF
jgi:hypothetical protein